jgi:hypothetical protein
VVAVVVVVVVRRSPLNPRRLGSTPGRRYSGFGQPEPPVQIIEVKAGAGEALRLDALHAQAIAFVAEVGHASR